MGNGSLQHHLDFRTEEAHVSADSSVSWALYPVKKDYDYKTKIDEFI